MASDCPSCGSKNTKKDKEKGEVICYECGNVFDDNINLAKEWRTFDSSEYNKKSRSGSPMQYSKLNKGISTMIEMGGRDARGNKLSGDTKAQMYRIARWHKRAAVSSSLQRKMRNDVYFSIRAGGRLIAFLSRADTPPRTRHRPPPDGP